MNPEIKAKWLEALRSGDYKQTTGALSKPWHFEHNDEQGVQSVPGIGFCCLGVLGCVLKEYPMFSDMIMDVPRKEKIVDMPIGAEVPVGFLQMRIDGSYTGLTPGVMYRLGISAQDELITMNDHYETFETIADWIEKNL